MVGSVRGLKWEEFPAHQKWFAMSETLAHLYYLADKGQVARVEEDGRAAYFAGSAHRAYNTKYS